MRTTLKMTLRLQFCYLSRPIFIKDIGLQTVTAVMLCYDVILSSLCYVTLRCHVMVLRYVMFCFVVIRYHISLCYVMFYYVMLHYRVQT
jgi:hypothetical protein